MAKINTFNKVRLIGCLGKDPEIRYTPNGQAVANLSIATEHGYKDRDGEWQSETEWSRCVAFGKLAERIGEYLRKGSYIYSDSGRLKTRSWEDKNGNTRYTTEIVLSDATFLANWGNESGSGSGGSYPSNSGGGQRQTPPQSTHDDDDIPF